MPPQSFIVSVLCHIHFRVWKLALIAALGEALIVEVVIGDLHSAGSLETVDRKEKDCYSFLK